MKIKQLSKQSFDGLVSSRLVLQCTDTNVITLNTLRRVMLQYVPSYAFASEGIMIEKTGSTTRVFDNDYMRVRLAQVTLQNLDNVPDYLPEKYWENVDYSDPEREKHPQDDVIYEMFINATNNDAAVLNVTTESEYVNVYKDGVLVKKPFGKIDPMLLIQLRKDEEFKCRMVAMLGVGINNNIWTPVSNAFYEETSDNVFKFTIESNGQFDEYVILSKACTVIKEKFNKIKTIIANSGGDKKTVIIKLTGENHTIGGIFNDYLQANKNISFSGLAKPDMLVNEIIIKVTSADEESPVKYILETIDEIIKYVDTLQKTFVNLSK